MNEWMSVYEEFGVFGNTEPGSCGTESHELHELMTHTETAPPREDPSLLTPGSLGVAFVLTSQSR